MWSRAQLKTNAKKVFIRNYWRCVAAALILTLLVSGSNNSGVKINFNQNPYSAIGINSNQGQSYFQTLEEFPILGADFAGASSIWDAAEIQIFGFSFSLGNLATLLFPWIAAIAAAGFVFSVFVRNPLEVGGNYFFVNNSVDGIAGLGDLLYSFKGNRYLSIVRIQLWRKVKTFLWTLCFIIPGIIKTYEYYMVPYLLADYPELSSREAFEMSRDMMMGHKFNTFVLELSFIGWAILSGITFGLLGIFYVNPYRFATRAELYLALKAQYNAPYYNPSDETSQRGQF